MNNRSMFPRHSVRSVPMEWVRQQNEFPKVTLNIDHTKETIYGRDIDRFMRDAMRDNPIDKMVKLITQRHAIQQSINTLLPKMTKDEVTEVYHTLYRIAQKVNEREEQ